MTKELQHLPTEKTLLKELKEDLSKWKDYPTAHGLEDNIKMAVLPNLTYTFSAIPIKILASLFAEVDRWPLRVM